MKNNLFHHPTQPNKIRETIKKQVTQEYQPVFSQARGWRKLWITWKIAFITALRYREILFLPVSTVN